MLEYQIKDEERKYSNTLYAKNDDEALEKFRKIKKEIKKRNRNYNIKNLKMIRIGEIENVIY